MDRPALATAALALSACLLAGCGHDDPKPKFAHSSEPPTVTPTSTSAAPKPETAEQFIRRWTAVSDKAQQTGDTATLRRLDGPDCESCKSLAEEVDKIYRNGGVIKYTGSTVLSIHRRGHNEFVVKQRAPITRLRRSKDGPWQSIPGGVVTFFFELNHASTGWVVADYSVRSDGQS